MNILDDIIGEMESRELNFVDFRFTDFRGKWLNITYNANQITKKDLINGINFYGRSFKYGSSEIDSDMKLMPDHETFSVLKDRYQFICSVVPLKSDENFNKDPRAIAKKAKRFLIKSQLTDELRIGPELEFFLLNNASYHVGVDSSYYQIVDEENPNFSIENRDVVNHIPNPIDANYESGVSDLNNKLRSSVFLKLDKYGIPVVKHHHESHTSQHEISIKYGELVETCDRIQSAKHIVKEIANKHGKVASFMPRVSTLGIGVALQLNLSLWSGGQSIFFNEKDGIMTNQGKFFIGGIIKHCKALNALCNSSTVSYKRLSPGLGKSLPATYGIGNRTVAIRIVNGVEPQEQRLEIRFPDATANPYLACSAILMAGYDGIENEIDPGEEYKINLFKAISSSKTMKLPMMAKNLQEAIESLNADRGFLKKGDVFTDDEINLYISEKMQEIAALDTVIHPIEFKMYFSC